MPRLGASDLAVHSLCVGDNVFGRTIGEPESFAVLDACLEAGGTFIALAWPAAQPTVTAPIASARTPEELPELLEGTRLALTDADLGRLREASDPREASVA